jgi:hypothetical protein
LTTRPVTPLLKYFNWTVSLFLFLMGTRGLLIMVWYAINSTHLGTQQPTVMLGEAIGSILFILAAAGVFEWRNWGRRLGIVLCALNILGTVFSIATLGPGTRIRLFCLLVILVLVPVWFFLPKVRAEFKRDE